MIIQSRPGFSMLELLMYMFIVAILAAGIFGAFKWVAKARIDSTYNKLQSIKQGIDMYQLNVGEWPSSLEDLYIKPTNQAIAKRWRGPYGVDSEADLNDVWGNRLQYQRRKGQPPYDLYSWGPKGEGSPDQEWIAG